MHLNMVTCFNLLWYYKHNVANDGTETEYEVQEESLCYHVLEEESGHSFYVLIHVLIK